MFGHVSCPSNWIFPSNKKVLKSVVVPSVFPVELQWTGKCGSHFSLKYLTCRWLIYSSCKVKCCYIHMWKCVWVYWPVIFCSFAFWGMKAVYHLAVLKYQSFVLTHLCGMPLFQVNSDSPILKTCYCPVTIASRLIRQHHPRCASVYMKLQTLKSSQRASYSIYFVMFSNFF